MLSCHQRRKESSRIAQGVASGVIDTIARPCSTLKDKEGDALMALLRAYLSFNIRCL